jgi:hypothetical protein
MQLHNQKQFTQNITTYGHKNTTIKRIREHPM